MSIQASAEATDFSQSLASLRQRPSQAKVRSTTHRRGSTSKPLAVSERVTTSIVHAPNRRERAAQFRPRIATVGEDVAEPRARPADRGEDGRRAVAVLHVGGMHDQAEQQTDGVDDGVALAPVDLLAVRRGARTVYGRLPRGKGSIGFRRLVGRGHVYGV